MLRGSILPTQGGTRVRWPGSIRHRAPGGGTFEGRGSGMAHLRVTPLSCFSFLLFHFSFFVVSLNCFLLFFFFFLSNMFDCWHKCQSLTLDVSSVVSAPWRCGVLTTWGGIAGIGLVVETPRLLARSLTRLLYCCCFRRPQDPRSATT